MRLLPLIAILSSLRFTESIAPGETVYNFSTDVQSASTSDEYACFVDAPHDHITTGCRKLQTNCSSGQAICSESSWDGSDYHWTWECSKDVFDQCGLQWCGEGAECVSINNCKCPSNLVGNPLFYCYDPLVPTSSPSENSTGCVNTTINGTVKVYIPVNKYITVETEDYLYRDLFIASCCLLFVFFVIIGVLLCVLWKRRRDNHMKIDLVNGIGNAGSIRNGEQSVHNETYGFFDSFGRRLTSSIQETDVDDDSFKTLTPPLPPDLGDNYITVNTADDDNPRYDTILESRH